MHQQFVDRRMVTETQEWMPDQMAVNQRAHPLCNCKANKSATAAFLDAPDQQLLESDIHKTR